MSYCSPTDLANVKTTAELTQLSDLAGTGSPNGGPPGRVRPGVGSD